MKKYSLILSLALIVGWPGTGQTLPSPGPTQGPAPAPSRLSALESAELESEMAEASYQFKANDRTLSNLIVAYEQLAIQTCLPGVPAQAYDASSFHSQNCTDILNKLKKIFPEDPLLACVIHGNLSKECSSAFELQLVKNLERAGRASGALDDTTLLDLKLDQTSNVQLNAALESDLYATQSAYLSKATPDNLAKILQTLNRLMAVHCQVTRTQYEQLDQSELAKLKDKRPSAQDRQRDELLTSYLNKLGVNESPSPTPQLPMPLVKVRVRYLPDRCLNLIDQALKYKSDYHIAICYRDGLASPSCIKAVQVESGNKRISDKQDISGGVEF